MNLRRVLLGFMPVGLLGLALAGVSHVLTTTQRQPWFLTGWILLAALGWVGLRMLRRAAGRDPSPSTPSLPLARANALLLVLYLWHTGFRLPHGGFEIALATLFGIYLASAVAGCLTGTDAAAPPSRRGRWSWIHEPVAYSLIPFALLHGVLAHAHGFLAKTFGVSP